MRNVTCAFGRGAQLEQIFAGTVAALVRGGPGRKQCGFSRARRERGGLTFTWQLPANAPDREIRLIEINELVADRNDDTLEPIDFGVDPGSESEHKLFVLDVTPSQWDRIGKSLLPLPRNWSLDYAVPFVPSGTMTTVIRNIEQFRIEITDKVQCYRCIVPQYLRPTIQ